MASINISFNDPQGRLGTLPLLEPTIRAAMELLSTWLVFGGAADIEVVVDQTPTGRFAAGGGSSFVGRIDGFDLWEPSLAAEARTGTDPDPARADISIHIDPGSAYLSGLWWDPAIAHTLDSPVPSHLTDAFSVILHELLHGLGVRGWRDGTTGALPADYQSTWDRYVTLADGKAWFAGPSTLALLGAAAEVRLGGSQGAYHLGHGPAPADSSQPWIASSVLNGYLTLPGERYLPGRLELAILEDLGWTLRPTEIVDVVNHLDSGAAGRYMVGWDRDERLSGSARADRIEGRDGDDTLAGGDGDDVLEGGAGNDVLEGGAGADRIGGGAGTDTAVYAGPRSSHPFAQEGAQLRVAGDILAAVERLQFDDGAIVFASDSAAVGAFGLYRAAFARAPDAAGLGFWLAQSDRGADAPALALAFARSAEFAPTAALDDAAFIDTLYRNALGRAPDGAGLQFWDAALDAGTARAEVLAAIASSSEATAAFIATLSGGIDYIPFPLP